MFYANHAGNRLSYDIDEDIKTMNKNHENKKQNKKRKRNRQSSCNLRNSNMSYPAYSIPNSNITLLCANNVDDSETFSPILPPDYILTDSGPQYFTCPNKSRDVYNSMLKTSSNRRRFVKNAYHIGMFDKTLIDVIDWHKYADVDIKVKLRNSETTFIRIRKSPEHVNEAILKLHKRLKKVKSNCRGKINGDEGEMHALGYYGKAKEGLEYVSSKQHDDLSKLIIDVGRKRKFWYKDVCQHDFVTNFKEPMKLDKYDQSLSDFMVHTDSLCNLSHYDVNDTSLSVCTWVEEVIGNTDNWYLVFPNVTMNYFKAIAVQLFHGCTITWDARILRHASSKVTYRLRGGNGDDNNATSGGNCELCRK